MNTNDILKVLIRHKSISSNLKSCTLVLAKAQKILSASGVDSKVIKSCDKPVLIWGQTDLENTHWLINSHLDVVSGEIDQFKPVIVKDKLFGRGSADTKSSCAILLSNAANWINIATHKDITFMLCVDEEIGGASTKELLKDFKNIQGSIFLEPTGEQMIIKAKGIMQIQIIAKGIAAHGSKPWLGQSALEKIISGLSSFKEAFPTPQKETRDTTFNFSILRSGDTINQIPNTAELWCDVRWNPQDDPNTIVHTIRDTFHDCEVNIIKQESAIKSDLGSLLTKSFVSALKHNSLNPISGFEHGSSDARHVSALNIPAIVFGPRGGNLHTRGEWVSQRSLARVTRVLDHWLKNI